MRRADLLEEEIFSEMIVVSCDLCGDCLRNSIANLCCTSKGLAAVDRNRVADRWQLDVLCILCLAELNR